MFGENDDEVLREDSEVGISTITLNRPETRNCLSISMLNSLMSSVEAIKIDSSIRCIVLKANGVAFCAGHDLKELTNARNAEDKGQAFFELTMRTCADFMESIIKCPKPVIAAVEGIATAAGCQLVASCDLAVAGREAKFATPGVNIGLFCSTPMVALSRNVPRKKAMEMLLLGDIVDAKSALEWGLINKITDAGKALQEANFMAKKIASKSQKIVSIGKKTFYSQTEYGVSEAYSFTSDIMVKNMLEMDAVEGIEAFLQKRIPKWSQF